MGSVKSFILELISFSTPRAITINSATILLTALLVPVERVSWIPVRSVWGVLDVPAWSIGLTRATVLFMHGRFYEAIQMNMLVIPVLAVLTVLLVVNATRWYRMTLSRLQS